MGLAIEVGYLADLLEIDPDGGAWFRESMDKLNGFLVSVGLPKHHEPVDCPTDSWSGMGYSSIHHLRRLAAHLDANGKLPLACTGEASEDAVLQDYYRRFDAPFKLELGTLLGRAPKPRTFDHLIIHGDAEGYYLPQDFTSVLIPPTSLGIPGEMVGSSIRLREECRRLAEALGLPPALEPEDLETLISGEMDPSASVLWHAYPIESYICTVLSQACEHSIKHGAAIVFC